MSATDSAAARNNLARKVLVTLAGGTVAYLAATFIDAEVAYQLVISVLVGGVLFVVVYLTEVEQRLGRVEASHLQQAHMTQKMITDGFTKINEATELFGLVEGSKLRPDVMTQLVRHSTQFNGVPPLVFNFAQSEITRLSDLLRDLANGSDAPYEGEDRDWMLGLTKHAISSIDAISLTTVDAGIDGGLWMSDLGQRYLQAQQEAVRRGVTIRRIFVTDKPATLSDKEFLGVCEMHRRMGIQVKFLDVADAPGTRANTMFDFIVFDGSISYESTPASVATSRTRQPIIINTRLVQQQIRVMDRIQRFHDLWSSAQETGQ